MDELILAERSLIEQHGPSYLQPKDLNEAKNRIRELFEIGIQLQPIDNYGWLTYDNIEGAVERFRVPDVASSDIEDFCKSLTAEDAGTREQNMRTPAAYMKVTGYTLSAFINTYASEKDRILLDISGIPNFGFLSNIRKGHVAITGVNVYIEDGMPWNNLDSYVVTHQQGGIIEVHGDYFGHDLATFMSGGLFILHGGVSCSSLGHSSVFRHMSGGEAVIKHSVPEAYIAPGMRGGVVTIEGLVGFPNDMERKGNFVWTNQITNDIGGKIYLPATSSRHFPEVTTKNVIFGLQS